MITDLNFRSNIGQNLRTQHLEPHWNEYFAFEEQTPTLHQLVESEFASELDRERAKPRPFIDAQRLISNILTDFGSRHNFHRQFNEAHQHFKPGPVLGMQLYALVARDRSYWVYFPTKHSGHLFPHATYFIPTGDPGYVRFLIERGA